ncbi:hypothetical protein ES332_A10G122900v1 [Gossypium tomentosum]|uniref:Uncharacterized protein n=1 Tax=Gossypium tomentosum TaxID=34277 RepID=A0A5D2NQF5_GOSTO|nr:hypothetical protein ES332_A10G122900v1 [Gossypium tomentosum]
MVRGPVAPQSFLLNRNLIPPSVRISRGPSRHLTTLNGDRRREICTLANPAWVLTLRASDFSPYTPSRLQLKRRRRGFRRFVLIGTGCGLASYRSCAGAGVAADGTERTALGGSATAQRREG